MIARAPGKVVLSGAYSVLEGAPALVAAVDRYVTADSARPAPLLTAEVQAAIASGYLARAPWFDAAELRAAAVDGGSRKLGLGSSAAILIASLAASSPASASTASLRGALLAPALAAHRAAQPGGSGIDVAASVLGGVLLARLRPDGALDVAPHALPKGLVLEVFTSPCEASTGRLIEQVKAVASAQPSVYRRCLDAAGAGARSACDATSAIDFVRAIDAQVEALAELGDAAGAAILTADLRALRPQAFSEGASFGPSGAGGGDIALYVGVAPSSPGFREAARAHGLLPLDVRIGAEGAHFA